MIRLLSEFIKREANVRYVAARPADVPFNSLNIDLIQRELSWFPETSLSVGIARTWAWICQHYMLAEESSMVKTSV
jgi:dTDP-D-glucose 4,6-dehydratase